MSRCLSWTIYSLLLGSVFSSSAASASPSFSCDADLTTIEAAICASERLSQLDRDLSTQFADTRSRLGDKESSEVLASQREWIKSRNKACSTLEAGEMASCLELMYIGRAGQLKTAINADSSLVAPNQEELARLCASSQCSSNGDTEGKDTTIVSFREVCAVSENEGECAGKSNDDTKGGDQHDSGAASKATPAKASEKEASDIKAESERLLEQMLGIEGMGSLDPTVSFKNEKGLEVLRASLTCAQQLNQKREYEAVCYNTSMGESPSRFRLSSQGSTCVSMTLSYGQPLSDFVFANSDNGVFKVSIEGSHAKVTLKTQDEGNNKPFLDLNFGDGSFYLFNRAGRNRFTECQSL